jgi:WD40 repeat protein
MRILKGPRKTVFRVAFSPDGRALAVGGHSFVSLWDLTSLAPAHTWPLQDYCGALAFSPDQQFLAATDEYPGHRGRTELLVWRLSAPEKPVLQAPGAKGYLWFHPDGSWLLAQGDDSVLTRWDTATWTSRVLWDNRHGWSGPLFCLVSVSPDGRFLARQRTGRTEGVGNHGLVELYDLGGGDLLRTVSLPGFLYKRGAFWPDGRHFLLTQENQLVVLDLAEGKEVVRRKSGRKRFAHLAVSPDGRWVLTAPWAKLVQLWGGLDCVEREAYTFPIGEVSCLAVAPDGLRAAAGGSSGQVVLWDLD